MSAPIILGIDEVGRGPWAGPLVIGAVILGEDFIKTNPDAYANLTDSKKVSAKNRLKLNQIILRQAAATGLGWVSAAEIDKYGLANSLKLATRRAVKAILTKKVPFDEIIIDGTVNFLAGTPLEAKVSVLKKADFLVKEVSAASIIAKVARDNYMINLAKKYPEYGFDKHVGYGTAMHQAALQNFGPCPEHRQSFQPIRALAAQSSPSGKTPSRTCQTRQNSTNIGQTAEQKVADFLKDQGHQIIAQNFKVKTCEIDIVSTFNQEIFFTEVKYRQDNNHGEPLAQITPKKLAQMHKAATTFLELNHRYQDYSPSLAAAGVIGKDFAVQDWLILA